MKQFSLKTKVTLLFPLCVTIVLTGILFLTHSLLQNYIKESISTQQYQILSILADDIDRSVADHHKTLQIIASRVTKAMVDNPEQSLAYLQGQDEHLLTFDNGLSLFDPQGRIVAEIPHELKLLGKNFSYREYFKQTIATRKPFLSNPFESAQQHHQPLIMFTAPIFDENGSLIAVMGGSVDLTRSAFIEKLLRVKLAKGGYLYLFNKDRMLISHPDKKRVMKQDVPPGSNPLFDRAIEGFNGTGETVTSRGLRTLSSFKHLATKNWIIAANYPLSEAYAPVYRLKIAFLIILPLLSLATFWFMRRYLIRFTDPIVQFTHHVENLPWKNGAERIFPVQGGDEVAILGQAFNTLVHETDLQREKLVADLERHERTDALLHRQNEYLTTLHETTLGLISRLDVSNLLQTIVTRAGKLVGTEHCFVYLANAEGTAMDMVYQSGIYNSLIHHPITPGQGIAGRVWNTGEPFHVDDYSRWEGRLTDPERDILHAMAGVPLKANREVIGVLGLAFIDQAVVFNEEQIELLTQFGELASLALDNARLFDAAQKELVERTKAEEELRKLSHVVEQSPVSIVITDLQGNIEYANQHFTNLTGYSQEELLGQNSRILKSGLTTQAQYQTLWETILSGQEWRGEFQNIKKNGDLYWELALISPLRNSSGVITHFMAIKEDITERKKMENLLRYSQKMEAVGQLAGGVAHDFNNILTAIIGYATILQIKIPENSFLKSTTDQILASAERGASLTQGLLAFSRNEVNNPVRIDLNGVLDRVDKLLMRLVGKDIRLMTLPSGQPLPVMADSMQMEQVLMNLISNARDAMPEGGEITISTDMVKLDSNFIAAHGFGNSGQFALLTVSDSGHGMEAETVKHIFEPFHTTKETGKGTGLGLSIVYGIIKKHNGYILCHSLPGTGTIFQVYLPLTDGDDQPDPTHEIKTPFHSGSETILLAEDDDPTRALARELLEEFGYTVIEAQDGIQALEKFREYRDVIRLVILDAIMPSMKGMDVYREIRTISPDERVIVCSGYAVDIMEGQETLDHNLHFIAKPFMPKELLMKIREVLGNAA
ncbi:MAG: PAS domain S-box protein [Verrucomicrobia bacterium]|nr:PAS domain S-box protein [Deltaproteobacteria bacterium]